MSDFYVPKKAMAIFAHPDDIEFSCAGTVARWAKHGSKISFVVITSGGAGIADPDISMEEAINIREKEAKAAADIAGAEEITFIGEPDGILQPTIELRKRLVREIRRFKPEVVICGDPTITIASETYINHPDHRAAGTLAIEAVFPAAGQPNLFEDIEKIHGFTAHKPRKVYISTWASVSTFVNIEETIDIKVAALKAHKSQIDGWDPDSLLKEWAAERAKGKEMKYAEGFQVITLVNDEDWELCKGDPIVLLNARRKEGEDKQKSDSQGLLKDKAIE